jgi:hypothetical protein
MHPLHLAARSLIVALVAVAVPVVAQVQLPPPTSDDQKNPNDSNVQKAPNGVIHPPNVDPEMAKKPPPVDPKMARSVPNVDPGITKPPVQPGAPATPSPPSDNNPGGQLK